MDSLRVWWNLLFFSLLVPHQWSPPWTWRRWSVLWKAGMRTRSSSPARTVSACHLKPRSPTLETEGSTSSSLRAFWSTTTSGSPFHRQIHLLTCELFTNSTLRLQASHRRLWQVPLHLPSLWGVQEEEEVTDWTGVTVTGSRYVFRTKRPRCDDIDYISTVRGRTRSLTPPACLTDTSGPCTSDIGKRWRTTATE